MAWNAESGEIMHAAYGSAQEYDLGGGMKVTGLSILFLNSPAMVEHDNGWFGPNPDTRYYGIEYNPTALQSPELRLTEAFMRTLGMGHWFRNLHRGDGTWEFYMPSLTEIPGFEAYVNRPQFLTASQRDQLAVYWRNTLLADMYKAQETGEDLTLEIPVVGDRNVHLTPGATVVVRLDRLKDHQANGWYWGNYDDIRRVSDGVTIRNIHGQYHLNNLTLTVDQPGYGPTTDKTYAFGMYPTLLLRALFSSGVYRANYYIPTIDLPQVNDTDLTGGVMSVICPQYAMPRIYEARPISVPSQWGDKRVFVGAESNVCTLIFQRS